MCLGPELAALLGAIVPEAAAAGIGGGTAATAFAPIAGTLGTSLGLPMLAESAATPMITEGLLGGGVMGGMGSIAALEGAPIYDPTMLDKLRALGMKADLGPMDALRINSMLGNFDQQQPQAPAGGHQRPPQVQQPNLLGEHDERRRRRGGQGMSSFLQGY